MGSPGHRFLHEGGRNCNGAPFCVSDAHAQLLLTASGLESEHVLAPLAALHIMQHGLHARARIESRIV